MLRIAPGIQGDGCIGLPEIRLYVRELAPLHIRHRGAEEKCVMLVIDHRVTPPPGCPVIVIGRELPQVRPHRAVLYPPVEIDDPGSVLVHDFAAPHQPVLEELLRGHRLTVEVMVVLLRHGRPVEIPSLHRFSDITVIFSAVAHEEPVLHTVAGCAYLHALFPAAFFQLSQHVPPGPHLGRVPVRNLAFVHLEAVMVLRHRYHVLSACPGEQLRPGIRIELVRREHGDEILIAEFRMFPIGLQMVLILRGIFYIHVPGVPLAAESGHAVDSPVNEDAELGVSVPFRYIVPGQGFPGVLIRPSGDDLLYCI